MPLASLTPLAPLAAMRRGEGGTPPAGTEADSGSLVSLVSRVTASPPPVGGRGALPLAARPTASVLLRGGEEQVPRTSSHDGTRGLSAPDAANKLRDLDRESVV